MALEYVDRADLAAGVLVLVGGTLDNEPRWAPPLCGRLVARLS